MKSSYLYLTVFAVLITSACVAPIAGAQVQNGSQDDEDSPTAIGKRAFIENCLICHGEEMSSRQRLTTKQWTAAVEKMIGWGAPVPPERKGDLIAFLGSAYAAGTPKSAPMRLSADALAKDAAAIAAAPNPVDARPDLGATLYAKNCATCHGAAGQGGDLGPRLVERPILVQDPAYRHIVRKGVRRMPGFALALKDSDDNDILTWLRSLREK